MMKRKSLSTETDVRSNSLDAVSPEKLFRADAKRNRALVLDVAHKVFTTEGLSVSMDEIARHAGVGVGTVYRHFPTKEVLFNAVLYSHKQRLVEEANALLGHIDPAEAFFQFFSHIIKEGIANKAISDAFAGSGFEIKAELSGISQEFWHAIDKLLIRAQQSGAVRVDVSIEDIGAIIVGILRASSDSVFPDRIVNIVRDGLRGGSE
jgi:AcrR family transcriptional regulator